MSQTRLQFTLLGVIFLLITAGVAVTVFFAELPYILIGGAALALIIGAVTFYRQHKLAQLPLKAHELEEAKLAHAQEIELARLEMERERHTQDLQIQQRRFELEQHVLLTRVLPDERGHYPYIVTQAQDGPIYQHLPNPYIATKQLGQAQGQPKDPNEGKSSSGLIIPAKYDLRDIWQNFTPSAEQIFLGMTAQGPVYVPIRMLWHIALTGPTGGGKTSILRKLLMQLAFLKCHLTLADIHYAPIKEDGNGKPIDWRPIEKRLAQPPIRDIATIAEWMEWLAYGELQARIDRQYRGEKIGRPLFFTIEELPAVLDEAGDKVSQPLAKILRQGRQYSICFVGASQDLLTKTLNMSQGPRECFRTGYYTGGDPHTAKALLDLRNGEKINEEGIGIDGLVYLKTAIHQAMQTRVGWASNEALYDLLDVPMNERLGRPGTPVVDANMSQNETFSRQNHDVQTSARIALVPPIEQAEVTSDERLERLKEYRLSDAEIAQFVPAYRAAGSIDKALSAIKKGTSYRDHARELVRIHNLRKDA